MRHVLLAVAALLVTASLAGAQPCTAPPAAPGRLSAKIDRAIPASARAPFTPAVLTLTWRAATGTAVYQVEAGSAPGRDDVGGTRVPATELSLTMPMADGNYFVRVRGVNACGASQPSNEARVRITGSIAAGTPNPLVVLSTVHASRERLGNNAFVRVMGQVRNGWNAAAAAFVTVNARYEGAGGSGLGVAQSAYANGTGGRLRQTGAITDTVIAPGGTGCFVLFTTFNDPTVSGLELTAASSDIAVDVLPEPLAIEGAAAAADEFGALVVTGGAARISAEEAAPAAVWVEARDGNGQVLDCRSSQVTGARFRVGTEAPLAQSYLLRWWSAPISADAALARLLQDPDAAPQDVAAAREAHRRELAAQERAASGGSPAPRARP